MLKHLFNIGWLPGICYIIAFLFSPTYGKNDEYTQGFVKNFDQIHSIIHRWTYLLKKSSFVESLADIKLNQECRQTLENMIEFPEQEWSSLSKFFDFKIVPIFIFVYLKVLDANGRLIRPGFLSGTITDFGDYDQCLDIDYSDLKSNNRIYGKYCLLTIRPPIPPANKQLNYTETLYQNHWPSKWFGDPRYRFYYRITNAICFPSQCHQREIETIAKKLFEQFNVTINVEACQTKIETKGLDFAQKISL